jgi:membrane protein DedA with SNARE-associated domain
VIGPLVLLTVLSWVGTLATPALAGTAPLALLLLCPTTPTMVLAAASNPLWLFVLVGTFRLAVADPFNFMVGRLWGRQAIEWSSQRSRIARVVWRVTERAMSRCGLLVVAIHPAGSVMVLAGATGMSAGLVAAADLIGTVVYLILLKIAAPFAVGPLQPLSHVLARHALLTTSAVVVVAAVAAGFAWQVRRRALAFDDELAELLDEPELATSAG